MDEQKYDAMTAKEHERFEGGYAAALLNTPADPRSMYVAGYDAGHAAALNEADALRSIAKDILYCLDGMRECSGQGNYGDAGDWAWRTRTSTNKLLDLLADPELDKFYRCDDDLAAIKPKDAETSGEGTE